MIFCTLLIILIIYSNQILDIWFSVLLKVAQPWIYQKPMDYTLSMGELYDMWTTY
jgi:hypothetical protein